MEFILPAHSIILVRYLTPTLDEYLAMRDDAEPHEQQQLDDDAEAASYVKFPKGGYAGINSGGAAAIGKARGVHVESALRASGQAVSVRAGYSGREQRRQLPTSFLNYVANLGRRVLVWIYSFSRRRFFESGSDEAYQQIPGVGD
jgi:hypothetical protein